MATSRPRWSIYALSVSAVGFVNTGMAVYALRGHRLCSAQMPEARIKYHIWRGLTIALVFSLSLLLLPLGTSVTEYSWLSLIVAHRVVWMRFGRPGRE